MSRLVKHTAAVTVVPNSILLDATISMEARGFLALLLTYAEGQLPGYADLRPVTGFGRKKFSALLNELKVAGYVKDHQVQE